MLAGFSPGIPKFTFDDFPTIASDIGLKPGESIFFAVIGRYIIKYSVVEIAAAGIAHELVGHWLQQLEGRIDTLGVLDAECEASLYELGAYQDLKFDKFSHEMIGLRRELENRNCDDFKRYMLQHFGPQMTLWESRDVDIPRLLDIFDDYVAVRYERPLPIDGTP